MAKSIKKEVVITATDRASATLTMLQSRFSKFNTGMQSVQRQAAVVGKNIAQIAVPVMGLAVALGAGIKKVSDYGDEMLTLAGIVGVPVEALQKLRYAAIQNDVSADGFDKSMKMLSKTMGEFNTGAGTLYSRLEKTNPALLKQLKNAKGNEGAFRVMMNAINNTTDAQEKAFLATSAFGRAGQELISLANIGADEMANWENEAEKFGIITEKDAATMDEFNKSIDRVKSAGMGLAATITSKLLPALTPIINQFSEWIAANREIIASKITSFLESFVSKLQMLWAMMQPLVWILSKFTWIIGVLLYAKVLATMGSILKLGIIMWKTGGAFLMGVKSLGLFTSGISAGSRALVIMRGIMGKEMFGAMMGAAKWLKNLTFVQWLWNASLWASPITWIIAGIVALVAGIIFGARAILGSWDAVWEFFGGLWNNIVSGAKWAFDKVIGFFTTIKEWISESWFGTAMSWVGTVTGITDTPAQTSYKSSDMSSLGRSQANIMTMGNAQQSADINVRFDNLPIGARVDSRASDTNLDMEVYRGGNGGTI